MTFDFPQQTTTTNKRPVEPALSADRPACAEASEDRRNEAERSEAEAHRYPSEKYSPLFISLLLITGFLFTACNSDTSESQGRFEGEGITIEDAWARPAGEGRISAAYFLITNFEDEPDTLISVQSDAARMVEIHESYQQEEDMMGMREVPELEIPANSTVRLEQGGLHVMLIQLEQALTEGGEIELVLEFANGGEKTVNIPVQK
ncbi:MAG: copper chaperone PCu(A)C [Balneolaceae bacterium]